MKLRVSVCHVVKGLLRLKWRSSNSKSIILAQRKIGGAAAHRAIAISMQQCFVGDVRDLTASVTAVKA